MSDQVTRGIVLWQPWASLLVSGIKQIETRPMAFPSTVELPARIAIYAAKKEPTLGQDVGAWVVENGIIGTKRHYHVRERRSTLPLDPTGRCVAVPLGGVVGVVTVTESLPIRENNDYDGAHIATSRGGILHIGGDRFENYHPEGVYEDGNGRFNWDRQWTHIESQRPFGKFEPGRFGWLTCDPVRFDQPITDYPDLCSYCKGTTDLGRGQECGYCDETGIESYPVRGGQGLLKLPAGLSDEIERRIG